MSELLSDGDKYYEGNKYCMVERNSVVVPIWYGSSRKPLSGVIGVLSAETESQPKECLREEGESK